ncbi:MAG: ABC transporter ATP-binding protein, partial [Alphaproteobacteria bacterium]
MLEVRDLVAGYGRMTILHGVQLRVEPGEIVCLIGPNGAGKSTVLRAVIGQIKARSGQVLFNGRDVTRSSPLEKGRQGMIFVPQGENIFPNLSLEENLEMAGLVLADSPLVKRRMAELYERYGWMKDRRREPARGLSGGQRQLLALARILIVKPRLVLVDEPSLGLSPLLVEEMFREIQEMNRAGISFLLVEQNARKGLSVSHRGVVLEQGVNRLEGSGQELLDTPDVQRLYLGG